MMSHRMSSTMFLSNVLCLIIISTSSADDVPISEAPIVNSFISLTFFPLPLKLYHGTTAEGNINVTVANHTYNGNGVMKLHACCLDDQISKLTEESRQFDVLVDQPNWTILNLTVKASRLGRTRVRFYVTRNTSEYRPTESFVKLDPARRKPEVQDKTETIGVSLVGYITTESSAIKSEETLSHGKLLPGRKPTRNDNEKPNKKRRKQNKIGRQASNNSLEYTMAETSVLLNGIVESTTTDITARNNSTSKDQIRFAERLLEAPVINSSINNSNEIIQWWLLGEYEIVVLRPDNWLETWLDHVVMVLIAINMVGIGGQIDEVEMLYLIKKPIAVSIGLFCRFGVMPALGLGLVELMKPSHQVSLSVLSFLCAPHEGASCLLVLLAEKDITLSFTLMTIINFTATALLPLWTIVFETRIYNDPGRAEIPFSQMFIVFGYTLVCAAVGFYLEKKCSKLYKKFWMYMPVFTSFTVLFIISVEIYKSDFIFQLITAKVFFLSAMLAVAGYIFGCAVAFVARQPISTIIVIAIETGCRTTYITVLLLNMSLDRPESDIARTTPVLGGLLTILPGFVAVLIHRVNIVRNGHRYAETECTVADIKEQEIVDGDIEEYSDSDDSLTEIKETSM